MAARRDGGANQQIVDLQEIIEETITELHEHQDNEKLTTGARTKKFKRLADKVKNRLHDDARKKNHISVTTYKRYVSKVRTAIKGEGLTHHSLHSERAAKGTLAKIMKDFPEYADLLKPLQKEHASTIGALKKKILNTIKEDKETPAHRRRLAYKTIKGDPKNAGEFPGLMTDHEVLRQLYMDSLEMAEWLDQKQGALDEKKTHQIELANADILKMISEGLATTSYTRQAFALALASGRRAIEVLFNAEFKKTGEHTVLFDGQAKKQTGIEVEEYEIYTLIPADDFLKAFAAFRKLEAMQKIHDDFGDMDREERNTEINRRTAKTMNEAAKRSMGDKARVFKDSRAIYTRVCLDTFYKTDDQWNGTDEDVFVKHLLGHGDFTAQAAYKQFKIDYEAPATTEQKEEQAANSQEKGGESLPVPTGEEPDTKEMKAATRAVKKWVKENPTRHQIADYHTKVIEWTNANPKRKITFSALYKKAKGGIGGHRDTITTYLKEVIAEQVEAYNSTRK